MEKKQHVDQKMNELFQKVQKTEPPDEIWDSIEQRLKASPRHLVRWRNKVVTACIGIAFLAGISQAHPVLAAIQNMATAIGGFGNIIHTFVTHELSGGIVETAGGEKIKVHRPSTNESMSQSISLDGAKRMADFPLYVLPPANGSLVEISKVNFAKGIWLGFIYDTPYGPAWVNERKYTTDDSMPLTRETVLISDKYKGYFNNGFLVWKAQDTWISLTFLSPPQLNRGEEIKAHLKEVADELQVAPHS